MKIKIRHVLNFSKIMMLAFILMLVFGIYTSYAYFILKIDGGRVSEMMMGDISYVLNIKDNQGKLITVPANSENIYYVTIESVNEIDSYYKLQYKVLSGNAVVKYVDDTGWNPSGYMEKASGYVREKTIEIVVLNDNNEESVVELGVTGGYVHNGVDEVILKENYTEVADIYYDDEYGEFEEIDSETNLETCSGNVNGRNKETCEVVNDWKSVNTTQVAYDVCSENTSDNSSTGGTIIKTTCNSTDTFGSSTTSQTNTCTASGGNAGDNTKTTCTTNGWGSGTTSNVDTCSATGGGDTDTTKVTCSENSWGSGTKTTGNTTCSAVAKTATGKSYTTCTLDSSWTTTGSSSVKSGSCSGSTSDNSSTGGTVTMSSCGSVWYSGCSTSSSSSYVSSCSTSSGTSSCTGSSSSWVSGCIITQYKRVCWGNSAHTTTGSTSTVSSCTSGCTYGIKSCTATQYKKTTTTRSAGTAYKTKTSYQKYYTKVVYSRSGIYTKTTYNRSLYTQTDSKRMYNKETLQKYYTKKYYTRDYARESNALRDIVEESTNCTGSSCLYGGDSTTNFIQYPSNGDKTKNLWRIMGTYNIDGESVVKLVSTIPIQSTYEQSITKLNDFYTSLLPGRDIYKTDKFNCSEDGCESSNYTNVGLISEYEYHVIGGEHSYLNGEYLTSTLTDNEKVKKINNGSIDEVKLTTSDNIYPVIYLNVSTQITDGLGTKKEPYLIGDNDETIFTYNGSNGSDGSSQTFIAPSNGYYKVELWGAKGGGTNGGKGAYTSGIINLNKNDKLYVYVGGQGLSNLTSGTTYYNSGGYNGGGTGGDNAGGYSYGGGGATDIRLVGGAWNDATGLNSRIMVAAGGAGTVSAITSIAPSGGTLSGKKATTSNATYNTATYILNSATQTSGGIAYNAQKNGLFGYSNQATYSGWGGGGSGGYWAGATGHGTSGSSGSSYVSGFTGCVAVASSSSTSARTGTSGATCTTGTSDNLCSVHYSSKKFINPIMISGDDAMPNTSGTSSEIGHSGNGYAKIIYIGSDLDNEPYEYAYNGSNGNDGNVQTFTAKKNGYYKVELWGAQGGGTQGGKGAYTSGYINLNKNDNLNIYVGGSGPTNATVTNLGGYNNGGNSGNNSGTDSYGGGGATDIRISGTSINDRIMVAAGGGGSTSINGNNGGYGGSLIGGSALGTWKGTWTYNGASYSNVIPIVVGATQISGGMNNYQNTSRDGLFGVARFTGTTNSSGWGGGAGGGYYTGANGHGTGGSGGSSYISGHSGCVAITSSSSTSPRTGTSGVSCTTGTNDNLCSVHYSNKIFENTVMIDGNTTLLNQYGNSEIGHSGNGYAKITYIGSAVKNFSYDYDYTGNVQEFIATKDGKYKVELWGAQGGDATYSTTYTGGKGAYTSGIIELTKDEKFYIYVGGLGHTVNGTNVFTLIENANGYNGGAAGTSYVNNSTGGGGGGATDIRFNGTTLNDRIMVAGGGGGAKSHISKPSYSGNGGAGGSLLGVDGVMANTTCYAYGTGGTQLTGGSSVGCPTDGKTSSGTGTFGMGYSPYSVYTTGGACYSGGGGGYYGGGAGYHAPAGGGSSYISGYAGCCSVTSSNVLTSTNNTKHYSDKYFSNTSMKSGTESFLSPKGINEIGHTGNGYARITYLGSDSITRNDKLNGVRYIKDCTNGSTANTGNHWVEIETIYEGTNIAKGKIGTLYNASNQSVAQSSTNPYSNVTDGRIDNITGGSGYGYGNPGTGSQCFVLDLGDTYDLDEIGIWHYWKDARTYYAKETLVSSDGNTYKSIFKDENNTMKETSNGFHISAYD